MRKQTIPLIFVGGFLGAGKTTLLWAAARRLIGRGLKVGLITNDQAPGLVDTEFLRREGVNVGEVAGSCFCCNFDALLDQAVALRGSVHADVLIAEPVGSCTDISATILQPLKQKFREEFRVAPFSVLADPTRLSDVLSEASSALHPAAGYIYWKQLEEADLILVNKCDLLGPGDRSRLSQSIERRLPGVRHRHISAQGGEGVDPWLNEALAGGEGGSRIVDVDYDLYAEGEAVLGWLNASHVLTRSDGSPDWNEFARDLMVRLASAFDRENANIGHVKILIQAGTEHVAGNLTRRGEPPSLRGAIRDPSPGARLTINARVEMPPDRLRDIVAAATTAAAGVHVAAAEEQVSALRPGRPKPTHRYASAVPSPDDAANKAAPLKKWIAAGLLVFLAIYASLMIAKEFWGSGAAAPDAGRLLSDGAVVFYFHGHFGCATCDRIERLTRETVATHFVTRGSRPRVAYRSVNTDEPANAHFASKYQLVTRTVAVVRTRGGRETGWKKLNRVWDLVGDDGALKDYVRTEILASLEK